MENKNKPSFPTSSSYSDEYPEVIIVTNPGLSKREYAAINERSEPPESFWIFMFKMINKRDKKTRSTTNRVATLMDYKEIAEVKSAWRRYCADALLAELDKPLSAHQ